MPYVVYADIYDLYVEEGDDVGTTINNAIANSWEGGTVNVLGDATFNSTVSNAPAFTMESDSNLETAPTIQAGTNRLFYDSNSSEYTFNNLTFQGKSDNTINGFGAFININSGKDLTLELNNVTVSGFSSTDSGGAIYGGKMNIRGERVSFTNNQTAHLGINEEGGGAIYSKSGTVTFGQVNDFENGYGDYTFSNNVSLFEAGAICTWGNTTLYGKSFTFTNNIAQSWCGGAFHVWHDRNYLQLNLNGETTFTGNIAYMDGGALFVKGVITANQFATFINNAAVNLSGGAIYCHQSVIINKGATFIGNTAQTYGGAIKAFENITFAGNNSVGTFKNNTASVGNDLYLESDSSVLTFKDSGTYSFDGGIVLLKESAKTIIDQAQVTIAGRENDNTNVYQLQKVSISNGGKLTVNLDEIESLSGTFNLANGLLTLNNGHNTATIKSTTSDGSFRLVYDATGAVTNESLVISSGRVDVKGCMEANVSVEANATFSPGNSVGNVNIDGDFTLNGDLLIEVDATGADTLVCEGFTLNGGTAMLNWQDDEIPFFATCDLITSTSDLSDVYANLRDHLDFSTSPKVEQLFNDGYITLQLVAGNNNNIIRLSIDRNAVPEPSTWALLVLGAAGLMYWRKRK